MQVPLAKERMISDWSGKIDSGIRRTTAIARSSDASLGAYFAEESKASSAASSELQKKIETLIEDADEKELFGRIGEQRKVYLSSRDQIAKLKTAGELEEANKVFETVFRPGTAKYQELIVELLKMQRAKIDAAARISMTWRPAAAICCTRWPRWCWPLA
jgi:methyl-accepting chemotaxis protein